MRLLYLSALGLALAFAQEPSKSENGETLYKIGGDVKAPVAIHSVEPVFSSEYHSGKVIVQVVVGIDGIPRQLRVLNDVSPELARESLRAIQQWRFEPARKNGIAVAVKAVIEINVGEVAGADPTFARPAWETLTPKPWETYVCKRYADGGEFEKAAEGTPERAMRSGCAQAIFLRNRKAGIPSFKRAAEAGLADAQSYLAALYWYGMGTKKKKTEVLKWAKIAQARGATEAEPAVSVMLADMSQKEIDKANKMSAEWLEKH